MITQKNSKKAQKKGRKQAACINAISGRPFNSNGLQPDYHGESLIVYPGYTEFRPYELDMIVNKSASSDCLQKKINVIEKEALNYLCMTDGHAFIDRINPNKINKPIKIYTPRGQITHISKKSANRLRKLLSSVLSLDLWIDLTFSDDVFYGMTFPDRLKKAYECLNEFERYVKKQDISYVWKKEIMRRLSGVLVGSRVPHYHVALCDLSEDQKKNWEKLSILLLTEWVKITGTKNPSALVVAVHKKSYRLITSSKMASIYIGKYFSKTQIVPGQNGEEESIGRAWGRSKNLIVCPGRIMHLNRDESIIIRRIIRKAKKFKKNKKFFGLYEQFVKGYSTFIFISENFIIRLLNKYVTNINQSTQLIPF